jgi:arylsulfatase A-like enzyme
MNIQYCQALSNAALHNKQPSTVRRINRQLAVLWVALTWFLGTILFAADEASGEVQRRPNIIYIMTDDLGYGDLGCYGQSVIQTPNLDQMAAEGLLMTDHYAGHTVCRPSRLVLWTGQHVGHTGLTGNRPRNLTGKEPTVARLLKDAGYATGGVGKWALGNVDDPSEIHNSGHPNNNGFDYWFGYLNQSAAHNYYPTYLWENDRQVPLAGNVIGDYPEGRGKVSSVRKTYSHDVITDAAFRFVRQHKDQTFLLHIHWTIPHANNEAGRALGDGMEVPDYGPYADRDWPNPEKGFAAMITRMDGDVGRLLSLLKELEIDENTIVFFTSDNGPHQEGNHKATFFNSAGPLKGFKRSMHDGGIRVPMLVRWPGRIQPQSKSDHPSAFWDFLPTACELAGATPAPDIDGISLLPTLLEQDDAQRKHEYLYWASDEGETSVGMRKDQWKLVRYRNQGRGAVNASQSRAINDSSALDSSWRLYNLADDIGETTNVVSDHPEVAEQMAELLRRDGLLK